MPYTLNGLPLSPTSPEIDNLPPFSFVLPQEDRRIDFGDTFTHTRLQTVNFKPRGVSINNVVQPGGDQGVVTVDLKLGALIFAYCPFRGAVRRETEQWKGEVRAHHLAVANLG